MHSATLAVIKNAALKRFLDSLSDKRFEFFANRYLKLTGSNMRFKMLDDKTIETEFHTKSGSTRIWLSERSRVMNYRNGLDKNLNYLAGVYHLDDVKITEGDTVIDCGANIGEIGVYLSTYTFQVNYIAFEPSTAEFNCCKKNNPNGRLNNLGLWKTAGRLDFYLKTDTADSSLIEPNDYNEVVSIEAVDLDSFIRESEIENVKLLKLEAEGAEPEILEGAQQSLHLIEYISIDAGPERGTNAESTLPQVTNALLKNGFEMVAIDQSRLIALFKNNSFHESPR